MKVKIVWSLTSISLHYGLLRHIGPETLGYTNFQRELLKDVKEKSSCYLEHIHYGTSPLSLIVVYVIVIYNM